SRRRHTRSKRDWSSDVCSSDLYQNEMEQLLLIEPHSERKIPFTPLPFSEPWDMNRDDEITEAKEQADGKIGMMTARGNKIDKEVQAFADNGAKGVLIDVE